MLAKNEKEVTELLARIEDHLATMRASSNSPRTWLTYQQVAGELQISIDSVHRLVAHGLRATTIITKQGGTRKIRRIKREWLDAYLEEHTTKPTLKPSPRRRSLPATHDYIGD